MNSLRRWMLALGVLSILALPSAARAEGVTNVQPPAGPPGTTFLFFASGFAAGERVGIWLNAPDGRIVSASAPELRNTTAYGDATWSWTAPADAVNGSWQMVIYGIQSTLTQVIAFTIGASEAAGVIPAGITPAEGAPGTLFRFYATGFEHREVITITISGPSGVLKDPALVSPGIAGPDGRIDGSWGSPDDAAPGVWQIIIRGEHGLEHVLTVTITPPPGALPASLTVSPASGAPGARFVASAAGFGADEHISVWLNAPDGRVIAAEIEGRAQAGPDGRAGWGWIAPNDAPRGAWQMVAHGRDSGIEAVANFTVQ